MGDVLRFDPLARRLSAELSGRQIDDLLAAADAAQQIRAFSPLPLFALVQEADPQQALELIHHMSGEQAQVFLDFAVWERDRVDMARLEGWLSLYFRGPDEQVEDLRRRLDPELVGLFLKANLEVYLYEDEEDASIIDAIPGAVESSPDGVYAMVLPDDEDKADLVRLVIRRLYVDDQDWTRQLLNQVRYELGSALEETAFQMRSGRLSQEGFQPTEEAIGIYAPLNPSEQLAEAARLLAVDDVDVLKVFTGGTVQVPEPVARELLQATSDDGSFFGRALRRAADTAAEPDTTDGLLLQLLSLVNQSVMADGGTPGNRADMDQATERVHGALNLGLEYLTRRDDDAAARLISRWPLRRIFRSGYSLIASLAAQAGKLVSRGQLTLVEELPYSLCSTVEGDLLTGLLQPRPLRLVPEGRGFQSLDEIDAAARLLARLAYKELWTFGLLGLDRDRLVALLTTGSGPVAPLDEVRFDAILATRAALSVLDDTSDWRLLTLSEVRHLVSAHIHTEDLSDALAEALASVATPPHSAAAESAGVLAERWVTDVTVELIETYGGLTPHVFDRPELLPTLLLMAQ